MWQVVPDSLAGVLRGFLEAAPLELGEWGTRHHLAPPDRRGELGRLPEVEMKGLRVETTVVGIVRDPRGELAAGLRQPGVAEGAAVLLGGDPLLVEPVLVHLTL